LSFVIIAPEPSIPYPAVVLALRLLFALREDYGGNALAIASDLFAIVYARPEGHDNRYFLSQE